MSRNQGTIVVLITLAVCLTAESVQAQSRWGVSFGNGGVRVGVSNGFYGPGYYGPGYYGPGYYGPHRHIYPGPVVVAPAPVIVPQPVYVQPQPTAIPAQPQYYPSAPITTSPVPPAPSPAPAPSTADGGEILLYSPAINTATVRYNLNGRTYNMAPGTKQKFINDRTWTIQFDSAPGQTASYTLRSARYKFKANGSGINIHETPDGPDTPAAGLPPAPTPEPPETQATVIPSRPALKPVPPLAPPTR